MLHPIMRIHIPMAVISSQFGNQRCNLQESDDVASKHAALTFSRLCSHNVRETSSICHLCRSSICSHANFIPTRSAHHTISLLGQVGFIA